MQLRSEHCHGEGSRPREAVHVEDQENAGSDEEIQSNSDLRRTLRAEYRHLQNSLTVDKGSFVLADSNFKCLIGQIEDLHKNVRRPREQVADAETMLQITSTLLESVKLAQEKKDSITPGQFVNALLETFSIMSQDHRGSILNWEAIGMEASAIFLEAPGVSTMLGPMDIQPRLRKPAAGNKREAKPMEITRPQEVLDVDAESQAEIEENMLAMFNILRAKKCVRLEALVLNRSSFAQTVENLFALSFLVKDGRAEINVSDNGSHSIVPRNAPSAAERSNGNVTNTQYVFRFDYKDWMFMQKQVPDCEELMQHRIHGSNISQNGSNITQNLTSAAVGDEQPATSGVLKSLHKSSRKQMRHADEVCELIPHKTFEMMKQYTKRASETPTSNEVSLLSEKHVGILRKKRTGSTSCATHDEEAVFERLASTPRRKRTGWIHSPINQVWSEGRNKHENFSSAAAAGAGSRK